MVLDVFNTVYIWIGMQSNKAERKNAMRKVEGYVSQLTDGRDVANINYVQLDPCGEPFGFTTHFPEWEEEVSQQWLEPDPYTAAMMKIEAEKKAAFDAKWGKKEETKYSDPNSNIFDIEVLKTSFPEGVDPTRKQDYISNEQFEQAFGMTRDAFNSLKDWKQKDLKKKVGLF